MKFFIGNTLIELKPGESIQFKLANANIGQPGTRSGSFTNDFQVALTPNTQDAIGYLDSLQSDNSFLAEKKHVAHLENDNGGEIARGYAQLVNIDHIQKTVTFTFYGGISSFIDDLKGKSIRDIWLWDLQHDWTEANIVASRTNTEGYIYPFIDYGRLTYLLSPQTYITDWYPAMYQHTLVRRMMEFIGWKVAGDIVDSWAYLSAVIPFSNEQFIEDFEIEIPAEAEKTTSSGYDLTELAPIGSTSGSSTEVIDFDTVIKDELGAFNVSTDRYVATKSLNDAVFVAKMSDTLVKRSTSNASSTDFEITWSIRKNGVAVQTNTLLSETNISGSPSDNTTTDDWTISATMDLVATDYVDVVIDFSFTGADATNTTLQLLVTCPNFNFQLVQVDPEIIPGENVTLHNNLPDIDQADFLKNIILRHGAIVTTDPFSKTVYLNSFEHITNQGESAEDWSDRVNLLNTSEIDFTKIVSEYGKKSYYRYKKPDDDDIFLSDYNDGRDLLLGDGKQDIDNDFINNEVEIYTSPFTATKQIESIIFDALDDRFYLPYIPKVSYDGSMSLNADNRILYVVPNTTVTDFTTLSSIVQIDGTSYTETAFAYFAKPRLNSDLDFITETLAYDTPADINSPDEGLLAKNYATWLRILQNPRYITLTVRLWEYEFSNLDLTRLITINSIHIKGLFLIDEILFNSNGDDLVKLIQIK